MSVRRIVLAIDAAIVACFALLHLAGARADVGVLSGTVPADDLAVLSGCAYALAWFAVVLIVPITTLAVLLDAGCGTIAKQLAWRRSRRP